MTRPHDKWRSEDIAMRHIEESAPPIHPDHWEAYFKAKVCTAQHVREAQGRDDMTAPEPAPEWPLLVACGVLFLCSAAALLVLGAAVAGYVARLLGLWP